MEIRKYNLPFKLLLKKKISDTIDIFNKTNNNVNAIRILQYHSIADNFKKGDKMQMTTPRHLFEKQMHYLKNKNYNVLAIEEAIKILNSGKGVKPHTICITFDDGYKDNLKNASPVLKKLNFKATIFITTNFVGKQNTEFGNYLDWQEIKDMKESGIFSFGCHSFSHKNLTLLNESTLNTEIKIAKEIMEDKLKERINSFAYPFGWFNSFNRNVKDEVKKEGFLYAFTGIFGVNTRKTDPFCLKRMRISWFDELDELRKKTNGSYDWFSFYQKMVSLWQKTPLKSLA